MCKCGLSLQHVGCLSMATAIHMTVNMQYNSKLMPKQFAQSTLYGMCGMGAAGLQSDKKEETAAI